MDPFLGEIRIFAGNFAPRGWAFCMGQTLSISQNSALFALLGTTYGGNGQTTFALPDLRGRIPVHPGSSVIQGQAAGLEQVTLVANQLPPHTHPLYASGQPATVGIPTGNRVANTTAAGPQIYAAGGATVAMSPAAIEPAGLSLPHENRMPYLAMSFIIAVEGIFPSRN
jgi:microcystin-dependent protein